MRVLTFLPHSNNQTIITAQTTQDWPTGQTVATNMIRRSNEQGTAMFFSSFYIIQLSNEYYIEHLRRSPPPATDRRHILPYHTKSDSPCEHNLPTPCPPSTPILVQLTNSGRNQYVQVHQGPEDDLLQRLHSDLFNRSAIDILNKLNNSPAVDAISPVQGSRHDHSFYIC